MDDLKTRLLWILSFLIFISSSGYAAEKIFLAHMSFSALQHIMPVTLSEEPLQSLRPLPQDLILMERHDDAQKTEHLRMQQRYLGFPVLGGVAILHRRSDPRMGPAWLMNGYIYQKLHQDLGDSPPDFVAKSRQVLHQYTQQFPVQDIIEQTIQPIVYVDDRQQAHWAYQIKVYLQSDHTMPSQPSLIVDAKNEHIFLQWDALTTLQRPIKGIGFSGNHRTGKYQFGHDLPYLDLIRDDSAGLCYLANPHTVVVDMHHRTKCPSSPMSFLCETENAEQIYWTGYAGDGYDQANGSYSVSNDAMYFGEMVKKMYRSEYGVEVLQAKQHSLQMILRVHFSRYFANAFWDGRQMTFGDGDEMLHPLVGLSITAHEISHGFTQYHSGLLYQGQAGGINEAFSDMASQAAEAFVYGKPTWQVGADVLKSNGALRYFKHPKWDGESIERSVDYQVGMDVHHSSGVYNRLFYLLATHDGWDIHKAFQVMLKANTDYWTPTTNFNEGSCGILAATRDMGWSEEDVKDALDEVTVDYGDC